MIKRLSKVGAYAIPVALWAKGAYAAEAEVLQGANAAKGNSTSLVDSLGGKGGGFALVANTLIYIVGAVAVIIIIIGGLRYVTSQGNSENVKSAKDTILYGVIGIVVALLAYAIVKFVVNALTK